MCVDNNINTKDILEKPRIFQLQNSLNLSGQSIPGKPIDYSRLNVDKPQVCVSSTFELKRLPFNGEWAGLEEGFAQLLPLRANQKYGFKILVVAKNESSLCAQLRKSSKRGNYTPDVILEEIILPVAKGEQYLSLWFDEELESDQYAFLTILPNSEVQVMTSEQRLTGILSLFKKKNKAVSNHGAQVPPEGIGVESFEFWTPRRRPDGKNLAFEASVPIELFGKENIGNGYVRPYLKTNAWAADLNDKKPEITLTWNSPQKIHQIRLFFDTDYDHPMESVLTEHPEDVIPFCIQNYTIYDQDNNLLFEKAGNYQTMNIIKFEKEVKCTGLIFRFEHPSDSFPATVFEIVCMNNF
jgi:hypothetical protein